MAEKTETQIFTIPLKDAWNSAYKRRAKKCMAIIRDFAAQHMKTARDEVKIGQALNQKVWERGIKSPPRDVRVQVVPVEGGIWVELADVEFKLPEKAVPRAEKAAPGIAGLKERLLPKIKEKAEEVKEKKLEEIKAAAKEEKVEKEEKKAPKAKEPAVKKEKAKKTAESVNAAPAQK